MFAHDCHCECRTLTNTMSLSLAVDLQGLYWHGRLQGKVFG